MNDCDQNRTAILAALGADRVSLSEAADSLRVSPRQLRRLRIRFAADGAAGIVHANRGRRPANACDEPLRREVVQLYRAKYEGWNQVHFTEALLENHGIDLSRSTVRRYLSAEGIHAPKQQRRSRHRRRRVRRAQEGALIQMDGSTHDWLEGRGPRLTLMGGIDDATNTVWATFYLSEQMDGYFDVFQSMVRDRGVPTAVYVDRTALVMGERRTVIPVQQFSQFGKALQRLGVVIIRARSPEAKGRIERLWRTLQDRLVSEMRSMDVKTLAGANRHLAIYLRRHNLRFHVDALDPEPAWAPWNSPLSIENSLCSIHPRVVRLDNTVSIQGTVLQLEPGPGGSSWARQRISVHQRLDGTLGTFSGTTQIKSAPFGAPRTESAA